MDYGILGALKLHKETAQNVTITLFYQHLKEETYDLTYAQTDYLNKLVNILKDFAKLELLKAALTTQTGKMEWDQTQAFSCFYRLDVPKWEFWLKTDSGENFQRIYEGSALERRLAGLAKAKAKRVNERRERERKEESKEVKEKLAKVGAEKTK